MNSVFRDSSVDPTLKYDCLLFSMLLWYRLKQSKEPLLHRCMVIVKLYDNNNTSFSVVVYPASYCGNF